MSAALEDLPNVCRRYLADIATLERVASAGRELSKTRMALQHSCGVMLNILRGSTRHSPGTETATDALARQAVHARLAESRALQAAGQTPWTTTVNTAYPSTTPPVVSVLVTLFNYRQYVARCLESVLAATPPSGGLEIVVVDDGSSDGGADVVESLMATSSVPMLLARKTLNSGLADARNVGMTLARGRQVFVLDADNWIYPPCLAVLQQALEEGDVAAAYGHIARIEEETGDGIDLVSSLDWSPRRLIEGPYIDAMALLDRQAVLGVGGYSTELIEHGWFGWEDYDLWLKLAQAGRSCRLVPRILAGYRDHGASMLRRTNRSSERLARYFTTKFARLLTEHPGLDTHFAFPATIARWPRRSRPRSGVCASTR